MPTRKNLLKTFLSDAEMADIRRAADRLGISLASFARLAALREAQAGAAEVLRAERDAEMAADRSRKSR